MKSVMYVLAAVLLSANLAFANCGSCDASKAAAGSHAECPMHKEKNQTLAQAANELRTSNPDLATKLDTMVKDCCGHSH